PACGSLVAWLLDECSLVEKSLISSSSSKSASSSLNLVCALFVLLCSFLSKPLNPLGFTSLAASNVDAGSAVLDNILSGSISLLFFDWSSFSLSNNLINLENSKDNPLSLSAFSRVLRRTISSSLSLRIPTKVASKPFRILPSYTLPFLLSSSFN